MVSRIEQIRQVRTQKGTLYDYSQEHEACGVGFIANLKGEKSHDLVTQALQILENLTHRGAAGCDPDTGDGAGIMLQMPDRFLRRTLQQIGVDLPEPGRYGVASIFLPTHPDEHDICKQIILDTMAQEGLSVLHWREVPVQAEQIGRLARELQPEIVQVFVDAGDREPDEFERRLYVTRKCIEHKVAQQELNGFHMFYICSMSSQTLVYKGLLLAAQVPEFYVDLKDPNMVTGLALVHQRYSTNTLPTWDLAHPFRILAHNGEINTLRGNINWMRAREQVMSSPFFSQADLRKLAPVINEFGSDSACADNCLELLVMSGRSLPEAMMMMVPEAWEKQPDMDPKRRAFYEYNACKMEPWDGPAAIAYMNGSVIGATLDRNGLRPARYLVTDNDLVVMASEAGVLPIPEDSIVHKGRLHPGRMFLIDTAQGRIIGDRELKKQIAEARPYDTWLADNRITLESLNAKEKRVDADGAPLHILQRAAGYTREDLYEVMAPMIREGKEPTHSMGNDASLAVLSNQPRNLYDYFKQLFAQVTNPPIDPIREELVMSLNTLVGSQGNLLDAQPQDARRLELPQPVLQENELQAILALDKDGLKGEPLSILFATETGPEALGAAVRALCTEAEDIVRNGVSLLVLSDRGLQKGQAAIPGLLAISAVNQHLIRVGLRTQTGLILDGADVREVAHFALLVGYGADAVCPRLALATVDELVRQGYGLPGESTSTAREKYIAAVGKGLLKIFSKMGISTLQSYKGAQIFEAVGLHHTLIERYFTNTASRIEGVDIVDLGKEVLQRVHSAWTEPAGSVSLPVGGQLKYRTDGEFHQWNPESIALLQEAVRNNDYDKFRQYARLVNNQSQHLATVRGLFTFNKTQPVPLEEVEPASEIVKRFATGAMSFGSISREAHETLAIAMNRLRGKSNTGEGGEDPARFVPDGSGDLRRSAIKQVASGRFGVTTEYLVNADELQIKMAQGAKPGEGGQLPGHKVNDEIASVRHTVPGVTLISPPPHHDIYSIEDLAQLIFDLKNVNPDADVSVKLVAEVGVGTIAAGVSKGHADMVLISGHDGGTGASPMSSIKHAGIPWEIGLAETQQVLVQNDLRGRIRVQTDGQLKTARDVAIAALLGAEEFGFATSALIVEGCIMMRKCHLNTCPVGIATQRPELRKRFKGHPDHVVNFFMFIARQLREIMAELGFRKVTEMVGRSDLLDHRRADDHWKAHGISLGRLLKPPVASPDIPRRNVTKQDHGIQHVMDRRLIQKCLPALESGQKVELAKEVRNINRTVGAMLSGEVAKRYGFKGLPDGTIRIQFRGTAGQSFGAFLASGIEFVLEGDANDYLGKGLCGGRIVVKPPREAKFVAEDNIIVGNTLLYGAISGELFARGRGGERFAVRNSGAVAVIEGVGDHGCEYMTGGVVVVLGETGRNFAAGMSGGIAYVYDPDALFADRCNQSMVDLERLESTKDIDEVKSLVERHRDLTDSAVAKRILDDWNAGMKHFCKVMPLEYRRILEERAQGAHKEAHNG